MRDLVTGNPCDTVIFGANGDGKSTLIALVLSCFETNVGKFLKHLSQASHKFAEYFATEPGFVLVEWQKDSGPALFQNAQEYFVTGQAVARRPDRSRPDGVDRLFFFFDTEAELSLDNLPVDEMRSFDRVRSWATAMEEKYGNLRRYFHTEKQETWRERLFDNGVDAKLVGDQVHFSVSEGGMDEAFLHFPSEDNFLSKFFEMSLNQEAVDPIRDEVAAYSEKARERPGLLRRLDALRNFAVPLEAFAGQVSVLENNRRVFQVQARRASGLECALRQRSASAQQRAEAEELRQAGLLKDQKTHLAIQQDAEAEAEALRDEFLSRQASAADSTASVDEQQSKQAQRNKNSLAVARLYRKIRLYKGNLDEVETIIAQATADLTPNRQHVCELGERLFTVLGKAISTTEKQAREANSAAKGEEKRATKALEAQRAAQSAWDRAQRRHAKVSASIQVCADQREALINAGILLPDEAAHAGKSRWMEQIKHLTAAKTQRELEVKQLGADADQVIRDLAVLDEQVPRIQGEIDSCVQFMTDAHASRESIASHPSFLRHFDADRIDPDATDLQREVETEIALQDKEAASILRDLETWASTVACIETTGLAFRDPDVEDVLSILEDDGIAAKPYAQYLAKHIDNPERARGLVLSNPARFLGVWLPNVETLVRAKHRLSDRAPVLRRPVVLSTPSLDVAAVTEGVFVIGPENNAAFNNSAAERLKFDLDQRAQITGSERERVVKKAQELRIALGDLQRYLEKQGPSQRALVQERLDTARRELGIRTDRKEKLTEKGTALAFQLEDLKALCEQLNQKLSEAPLHAERCAEFERMYERHLDKWTAELHDATRETEEAEKERDAQQDVATKATVAAADHRLRESEMKGRLPSLRQEWKAISHRAEGMLVDSGERLEDLRARYKEASQALADLERDRLAGLEERGRNLKQQIAEQNFECEQAERPWDESAAQAFGQLDESDLDREVRAAQQAIKEWGEKLSESKASARAARVLLKEFRKQRKSPNHEEPRAAELSIEILPSEEETAKERAAEHAREAQTAFLAAAEAGEKAGEARKEEDALREKATEVKRALGVNLAVDVEAFEELPDSIGATRELVGEILECVRDAGANEAECQKSATKAFDEMKAAAGRLRELEREKALADLIASHSFDTACRAAPFLPAHLRDRIETLEADLEQFSTSTRITVESLDSLLSRGVRILRRAANVKVPSGVPQFAGMSVLKFNERVLASGTGQERLPRIELLLNEIVESGNAPPTGAALAVRVLRHMIGGASISLNLRLLKLKQGQSTDYYMPVSEVKTSGGEGLTTAILLYCVLARLRAEEFTNDPGASGGVLILDNPFAKANKTVFLQAQRQMAAALGIQLIYATGLKDYNALSQFPRFWRMRPAKRGNGRIHLEFADMQVDEQ